MDSSFGVWLTEILALFSTRENFILFLIHNDEANAIGRLLFFLKVIVSAAVAVVAVLVLVAQYIKADRPNQT